MKLDYLCFAGDLIWDRRIREESNYSDSSHIFAATHAVTQLILHEISPCDLDGNSKLTIDLNIDQEMRGRPGYNCDRNFKVSFYNLDRETSLRLYAHKTFDLAFQRDVAGLLLDVLTEIDRQNKGRAGIAERREAIIKALEACHYRREIPLDKFSKYSRDRARRALLCRHISQDIGEGIRCDLLDVKTGGVLNSQWITPIPGTVDQTRRIQKTCWDGDTFKVFWKGNRETACITAR